MGNRAVITTKSNWENDGVGVYLHWNGGRDSVEAFLKYCELKGYRPPDKDNYGWARLCQVIANFFGGDGLSIGIDILRKLDCDNGDNGVYIVEDWKIVDRKYHSGSEQCEYDLIEMLKSIDESQPTNEQLGDYILAEEIKTSDLKVGDKVCIRHWDGKIEIKSVVGFGKDKMCNGTNVKGLPYVDLYLNDDSYENNINNYIQSDTIKIVRK